MLTYAEVNTMVAKLLELKKKLTKDSSPEDTKEYKKMQTKCINALMHTINTATAKYKKFSNYQDLRQDGLEALMSALNTFDPKKGDVTYWVRCYVKTKVSRSANKHSTIKIPLKKAKDMQPYKTSSMPVMIDINKNPAEALETEQMKNIVRNAICEMPENYKYILTMYYDENLTIGNISKELNMSRINCQKLLEEAKENIKLKIGDFGIR